MTQITISLKEYRALLSIVYSTENLLSDDMNEDFMSEIKEELKSELIKKIEKFNKI